MKRRSLFPYFALATVLVVGTGIIVAALHPFRFRIVVGSGRGTIAPKPAPRLPSESRINRSLYADAPWALSALPECLIQVEEWTGVTAAVRAHLPPDALPVAPPATLRYADCTVRIVGSEAYVTRGDTYLRIPPYATFYRVGRSGIALVRSTGCNGPRCSAVLRVYVTPAPSL